MPSSVDELVAILNPQPGVSPIQHYYGEPGATLFQRTYGGLVLAQALMSAYRSVPTGRTAHSMHAYFVSAAQTSQGLDYQVDQLRDGGSFSTRQVTARQGVDKRVCFTMSASFHADESGLDHAEPMPTDTDPPEECPPLIQVMNQRFGALSIWHEWDCLDVRFAGDSSSASTNENRGRPLAWMRVWVRTAGAMPDDAGPQLHQGVLSYLSDLTLLSVATLPHEVAFLSTSLQTASLSHSMWFHRPARADRWLLYDIESPNAHASLGFSTGRLFQDGALVASCAQEGLVRLVENRAVLT